MKHFIIIAVLTSVLRPETISEVFDLVVLR